MNSQTSLDKTPFEITNEAVDLVRDNNRAVFDEILVFATEWVKNQFKPFSSENLKNCYYLCGKAEPIEPRVYGAVFRELSRSGLIIKNGFELSKNPKCHSRPQQQWISREYSVIQSNNRKKKQTGPNLFEEV